MLLMTFAGIAHAAEPGRVLLFSKTLGWRHDSIPAGIAALQKLAADAGLRADATEDAAQFTADNLKRYRAVVFVNTTGSVLDAAQQRAFEGYIRGGGGFMGVHSAADTHYDWPWYGRLVGAWFLGHPPGLQDTRVEFAHDGIADGGRAWRVADELYNYRDNPRGRVDVIAGIDESTYEGGTMGDDHPIAWCHAFDGGRAWYTGLGHRIGMYSEPVFLRHLARGLRYASGLADAC
ncbi:hypothetical protein GCM10027084_08500 [Pseudoxanthomonas sangjuensis]